MSPLTRQRGFAVALGCSLAAHLGMGFALGQDGFVRLLRPRTPVVVPPEPQPVRFTLVESPDSAETDVPPEESRFVSDRNTRAQDQTPPAEEVREDQPRIEEEGESYDLRTVARAPVVAIPNPTPPPPAAEPRSPAPVPLEPAPTPAAPVGIVPERPPAAEPVPQPAPDRPVHRPPPPPPPPITLLPKKGATQERRQIAKLQKEIAALRAAAEVQPGRVTESQVHAVELANARVRGEFSYGAAQHFFGAYLLEMKRRVEREWFSRLLTDYSRVVHSRVVIDFKVYGSGSVGNMAFVEQQGDEYFAVLCWHAIEAAAPFDTVPYATVQGIPPELQNKPLNIRFTFHYN